MITAPVLVVTGGSRGIGAATARLAADRGFAVALTYNTNQNAADAVVNDIEGRGGVAVALQCDVSIEGDVSRTFEQIDRRLGRLAALVNNAGVLETQMRLENMTAARLNRIFAINVTGSFLCAREGIKRMSTRHGGPGGSIVNVSSAAARLGGPGEYVDYAASKGALDTMTIGLAQEVVGDGIRVNAVRPGVIYTGIHADGGEPNRVDRVKQFVPMKRGGQPEEVARAILWLISSEASYSTGTFIDVSGGR
jgi:NAD(P)-dependent dehydrogenase (short-subunit alcohol dehydrogenase family)